VKLGCLSFRASLIRSIPRHHDIHEHDGEVGVCWITRSPPPFGLTLISWFSQDDRDAKYPASSSTSTLRLAALRSTRAGAQHFLFLLGQPGNNAGQDSASRSSSARILDVFKHDALATGAQFASLPTRSLR